ncbi:TPM domain-containing protein [Desulfobulbus elongatus]|uniref:TPM domain-containing protein n=1 Tax=Desulfobulbus elongatus TaxID=53332 RepID=UPI0006859E65|nr:TPM domain-containing protein [Desulfobulbus elongatus]
MQTLAQRFLTADEQERIARTVEEAERRTTGEIVPMVVSASHAYPEAVLTGAAVLSLPAALIAAVTTGSLLWWQDQFLWLFLAFLLLFFPLARLLMRLPFLLRPFISERRAAAEVERAAVNRFYREGLQDTRDATGVLIYVSVLERRVWILGDRGINERLEPQVWQGFVDTLVTGIREDRAGEALCQVIEEVGALLHAHFPPRADDRNELANLLIAGEDGALARRTLIVQ